MPDESKTRLSIKRRRIVETGETLFNRFGFKRVTVEEICRKAGASKMTFYKYFPNKIELLKTVWTGWIKEGYARLDELDAQDIPFPEKMQKIIQYKVEMLSKMSPEYIDEIIDGSSEIAEFIDHMRHKNLSLFMKFVSDAQDRGDMRMIRPEFVLAVIEKLKDLMNDEKLRGIYSSDVEFIREINNFLFFGILPVEKRIGK